MLLRAVELTSPFNQHHSSGHSLGHRGRDPKKSFEDITGAPKTPGQTFTAGPLETTLYPPNPARHKPELHQASFRINRRNRRHLISSVVHERDLSQRNRDLKSSVVEVVCFSATPLRFFHTSTAKRANFSHLALIQEQR
ncbi:hypothetical protein Bca101_049560 [Brassica carinata]